MIRCRTSLRTLALLFALAMTVLLFTSQSASAQLTATRANIRGRLPTVTFKQRLQVGLRVKTASDAKFVDRVIELADNGTIPVALVDSTFFWARRKGYYRGGYAAQNPMVYFRPAMRLRARALGVTID